MRKWSIHLFPILGIRLEVHLTFFVLALLVAYGGWQQNGMPGMLWGGVFLAVLFTCVTLHELGHSLAARRYGIEVSRILLLPFGGVAQFRQLPRDPGVEFVITAAGPAVNFFLFGVLFLTLNDPWAFFRATSLPDTPLSLLESVLAINLVMGIFNLLPIFPMDGGRLLRAALATRLPYLKATLFAVTLAKILSVAGLVAALLIWENVLLAFLFTFIFIGGEWEYRATKAESSREQWRGIPIGEVMRRNFLTLHPAQTLREAALVLRHHRPQDMLLMVDDTVCGIVTREQLAKALRNASPDIPVGRIANGKFSVLQANWPLEVVLEMIQAKPMLCPVYENGVLCGVLDPEELEEGLHWHLLRLQMEDRR